MSIEIRPARTSDADAIAAIYAPIVRETSFSFEVEPPTPAEFEKRIDDVLRLMPWLVVVDGDEVLAYAYASPHRDRPSYLWAVNTSVYVAPAGYRRGFGTLVYKALFELVAAQGFYQAFAGITLPNAPSVGLHESLGFSMLGLYKAVGFKLGAWHDVGWWQRPLRDAVGTPKPPVMWPEFVASKAGRALCEKLAVQNSK